MTDTKTAQRGDKANIYAAFVKAQKEFAPALKTATNPHLKTKYADLAACVEAVLDALHNNGFAVMQKPIPDDKGATVETLFLHESGDEINGGQMHVPATKHDPQGFGSSLTYARRYGLMAACGIAPQDDDGNAASAKASPRAARAPGTPIKVVTDVPVLIKAMEATKTQDALRVAFASAWKASGQSQEVRDAYERLKAGYGTPADPATPEGGA